MCMCLILSVVLTSDRLLVHSFIRETFTLVENAETSIEILSVTNLVSDTLIVVALCGLLGVRRSKVQRTQ
jgi:hypothetical protein